MNFACDFCNLGYTDINEFEYLLYLGTVWESLNLDGRNYP